MFGTLIWLFRSDKARYPLWRTTLDVENVADGGEGDAGATVAVSDTIRNLGGAESTATEAVVYLSADTVLGAPFQRPQLRAPMRGDPPDQARGGTERNEAGNFETTKVEFAPEWSSILTVSYEWKTLNTTIAYTARFTGPMALPEVYDLDENGSPVAMPRPTVSNTFALRRSFSSSSLAVF